MLKATKRSGRWYSRRRRFAEQRKLAIQRNQVEHKDSCENCEANLTVHEADGESSFWIGHCDHFLPERFLRRFCPGADVHSLDNLSIICPGCHGRKTKLERYLYAGDLMSFSAGLQGMGIDNAIKRITDTIAKICKKSIQADK